MKTITHLNVVNNNFPEAIGKHVLGAFGRTITNLWHKVLSLELPADSVVNTLRSTPVPLFKNNGFSQEVFQHPNLKCIHVPSACHIDHFDDE